MWFAIDTLEYLRRGGRIGGAQAWLGSALKIKPILTVESEITPIERVRTSRRAFERMVELLRSRAQDGADAWMVQHIQAPEEAAELARAGHRDLRARTAGDLADRPGDRDPRRAPACSERVRSRASSCKGCAREQREPPSILRALRRPALERDPGHGGHRYDRFHRLVGVARGIRGSAGAVQGVRASGRRGRADPDDGAGSAVRIRGARPAVPGLSFQPLRRRRPRPPIAAIPPASTKPVTAAPISTGF